MSNEPKPMAGGPSPADDLPPDLAPGPAAAGGVRIATPRERYVRALEDYRTEWLAEILESHGRRVRSLGHEEMVEDLVAWFDRPKAVDTQLSSLDEDAQVALRLAALGDGGLWSLTELGQGLLCLGVNPAKAIHELTGCGLVALWEPDGYEGALARSFLSLDPVGRAFGFPHPAAVATARPVLPDASALPRTRGVKQVRETDGLEFIVRLGALWQLVGEAPLRQTQQGQLYKRDRDRLEESPALGGPIADSLEPIRALVSLWIDLAYGIGMVAAAPEGDRLVAASAAFWEENANHLPQMLVECWLGMRTWNEPVGDVPPEDMDNLAGVSLRAALLLWLAAVEQDEWVALEDLDALLVTKDPNWHRLLFRPGNDARAPVAPAKAGKGKRAAARAESSEQGKRLLEAILLGPAYQLGLVRAGEENESGRRVVQLTSLGRYVLALGPPPEPRQVFPHCLYVQPNFEMIVYRQGLTPALVGQLSRFAQWGQVGAALELKLTPESVYHGLEGGMTPEQMLEILAKHSARPLPAGVAEAVRTWAGRRERLSYYASATLVEFATPESLQLALADWPAHASAAPVPVSDRLLLVEDERSIPFHRFRMTGSRDYRRPPEACVEIESDGITLGLDLARSDLLIDAELSRFADELTADEAAGRDRSASGRRRFRISRGSLERALSNGLSEAHLARWFADRTGSPMPPAGRLLLHGAGGRTGAGARPLSAAQRLVLTTPAPELLDGLLQHPATRDALGERLGPAAVVISPTALPVLKRALEELGVPLELPGEIP